ncbi:MAG: cell division protein FtsL [Butyrivibrio sp.]|nr:cell division protein FtsL [Butyrivibrio sp.]
MANAYIHGNTARRIYEPDYVRRRVHVQEPLRRNNRRRHMSLGYLMFLSFAMLLMVGALAFYISLQSHITNSVKNIANLEKELNRMKQDNDEAYNRANGNIDLDEIQRIAIQEYGMVHATGDQIVTYSDGGGNDYVRQVAPVPSTPSK